LNIFDPCLQATRFARPWTTETAPTPVVPAIPHRFCGLGCVDRKPRWRLLDASGEEQPSGVMGMAV